MQQTINEKVVASLQAPASGNKVHYFSGATLGGRKAPAGFGVRVTASGVVRSVPSGGREERSGDVEPPG